MATFTSTADLNIRLPGGFEFVGQAGATHRLPDSLSEEFERDHAPNIPGFAWVSQDETTAIAAALAGKVDATALSAYLPVVGSSVATVTVAELRARGGPWYDVTAYGATGDGSTDDTAAIQSAITAASSSVHPTVYFPAGVYVLSAALAVPGSMTLTGPGELRQTADSTAGISVQGDNVDVIGLTIARPSAPSADQAGSHAVTIVGPSASAPHRNVRVLDCTIRNWNRYGVLAQYAENVMVRGNVIRDIFYAGVMGLSLVGADISGNDIADIGTTGGVGGLAYGISLSRAETDSLATDPLTSGVTVTGNRVRNVTPWEGIDTHGGRDITITGNIVLDCPSGIAAVPADASGQVQTWAPQGITISGNVIRWTGTAGAARAGISLAGAGTSPGAASEAATGSIVGNTIFRHGEDSSSALSGGIYLRTSLGVTIAGNVIVEPTPVGIVVYHTNTGFSITGNQVIDAWSDTASSAMVAGINMRSSYNEGLIAGNIVTRGSKSATTVLGAGIRAASDTANSRISLGANDLDDATTPLSDAAPDTRLRLRATRIGLYAADPVARQIVTGSRSSGAALTNLLTALSTVGIITNSTSA